MKSEDERTCGSCTACCDGWLQIEVRGHRIRPGKPCPFSVEHRCSIYSERPQHPCREFVCGWLTLSAQCRSIVGYRQLLDAEWGLSDDTRHTGFPRSSAINSAPERSTANPTGLPRA